MTPPSTHGARRVCRSASPPAPRRTSGPARPRRTPAAAAARGGAVAVPTPFGLRVARRAVRVGDARLLDRLVRGRAWIAIVAVGLLGIVFMQVSMLRLNAGISRAVTAAETLQRQNSTLRADISELDSGQRIQDTAAGLGMVMPEAGKVHYLDARRADGRAAARGVRAPSTEATATVEAAAAGASGEAAQADGVTGAAAEQTAAAAEQTPTAPEQTAAPPEQAPAATTSTAPPAGQTAPGAQTTTQAPAATAPAAAVPPSPAAAAPSPPVPEGGAAAPQGG
jgi:hypothetical protein